MSSILPQSHCNLQESLKTNLHGLNPSLGGILSIVNYTCRPLAHLITKSNLSFVQGIVPRQLKRGKVVPIFGDFFRKGMLTQ